MSERRAQGLWTALLVSSVLWSTLLVVAPGNLYRSNIGDFTLLGRDLVAFSLPLFAAATLASTLLLMLIRLPLRRRLVSLLLAFAVSLWFQGNILVWQYGALDGQRIAWGEYWLNGVIDGAIWLAVLGWSLARPASFYRVAPVASAALLVLPIVAMFAGAAGSPAADSHSLRGFTIDESAKYTFSKNRNVILLVLDEFQSDVFQEIVEAEEEYAAIFEGFTYFPDALAGSNYTELAIPALLTGRIFDNSQTRSSFLEQAYLDDSIMANLKRHGYTVDIHPWVGWANEAIFFDERIASNLKRTQDQDRSSPYRDTRKVQEFLHLLDLSVFRSTPHFLRRNLYEEQPRFLRPREAAPAGWPFQGDAFVAEVSAGIESTRAEPVFKYYHLKGAHTPLTVNEDLEFTDQTFPYSRRSYTAQAKASLRSVGVLLEALKRHGIFDESLVIVVGDHGSGNTEDMHVGTPQDATRQAHLLRERSAPDAVAEGRQLGAQRTFGRDKARGIPILLVKRSGSKGRLETSKAPVSLLDVPATVFSELGLEANATGVSVYEVDSGAVRTRRYGAFDFKNSRADYVGPIVFYEVTGDSWLDESWRIEGIQAPPTPGRRPAERSKQGRLVE